MNDLKNFKIINGVIYKYLGNDEEVVIPESVVGIKEYAFARNKKLQKVEIPPNVEYIQDGAFFGCTSLKIFKMHPDCKTRVSIAYALYCCSNLEYLVLPDNLKRPVSLLNRLSYKADLQTMGYGRKVIDGISDKLMVVARNVHFKTVPTREKKPYVYGFINNSDEYPDEIAKDYIEYLRKSINKWIPYIANNTKALSFALQKHLIKKTIVDDLLEDIQKTGDAERTSMMIEYINNNYGAGIDNYFERKEASDKEKERKAIQQQRRQTNKIIAQRELEEKERELEEKRKDPNASLDIVWTINKHGGECILSNYKGCAEVLIIPETYDGLPIKEIAASDLNTSHRSVKKIVLPDTVERLSDHCFSSFTNLESIELGKGIKRIGKFAFMGCSKLKTVVLPEGITRTSKWMFRDCKSLEKVVFLNKYKIFYEIECNFLRGSKRAKVYVYEGTELVDFMLSEDRIVRMDENGNPINDQKSSTLQDMIIVHTGFSREDEKEIEKVTYDCGGIIKNSVVLKTDILVYNPDYDHETVKLARAKELNDSGKSIKILTLDEFLSFAKVEAL